MKRVIQIISVLFSAALMVCGMLYIIDKSHEKKIGGKLIKVDYRFSKEFD